MGWISANGSRAVVSPLVGTASHWPDWALLRWLGRQRSDNPAGVTFVDRGSLMTSRSALLTQFGHFVDARPHGFNDKALHPIVVNVLL